jgi:uncharacterized membrane protein
MSKGFWNGFTWGALSGVAAGIGVWSAVLASRTAYDRRILRLERSVQIGRPQADVFRVWQDIENLPNLLHFVDEVRREGERSEWTIHIDGRPAKFLAETTQIIPNEAIGWKSVAGPKHSGRINFAKLGNDTLVHVTMNYAPPGGRLLAPFTDHLESIIEEALREFKAALEGQSAGDRGADRQFALSSREGHRNVRRDLLEADGALLEGIRGGTQKVDRRRADDDRNSVYSPNAPASYGKHGPQSAGWDEVTSEEVPQKATGTYGVSREVTSGGGTASSSIAERFGNTNSGVDYTRRPEDSYPSGREPEESKR